VILACGSANLLPANDTWQASGGNGAVGMSNYAASPVNSTFDLAFVQHEPGALCTTPLDLAFNRNLDACLRYYAKSYDYATKPATAGATNAPMMVSFGNTHPYQWIPYPKMMAKVPTIIGYSPSTGAAGNVRDVNAAIDRAISTPNDVAQSGFSGFSLSTLNASATNYTWHYTADTGW
jgi:hypothetical protein